MGVDQGGQRLTQTLELHRERPNQERNAQADAAEHDDVDEQDGDDAGNLRLFQAYDEWAEQKGDQEAGQHKNDDAEEAQDDALGQDGDGSAHEDGGKGQDPGDDAETVEARGAGRIWQGRRRWRNHKSESHPFHS